MNLQFQAELFNIFNNVNFLLPVNDINSPNFRGATRPHSSVGAEILVLREPPTFSCCNDVVEEDSKPSAWEGLCQENAQSVVLYER
jgi:hypothetical protein